MAERTESEPPGAAKDAAQVEPEPDYPSTKYAWFVVAILMIVYVFSFIDRQILGLLVGPIRADLGISDTQMSYLMGFSFAVFYTLFGLPMGRLADSASRRTIIAAGLTIWSFMSAGCGLARNYVQLLALRIGVGVGESTLSPSAYSLIADYFPPKRLALAISVYGMGIYLGGGMANLLGGLVVGFVSGEEDLVMPIINLSVRPWQVVFFIIGLPGILFACFVYTIKEPVRRGLGKIEAPDGTFHTPAVPLEEVGRYLRYNRGTVLCHTVGFALLSFVGYGAAAWLPTFFVRTHGWTPSEAGIRLGIAGMIFGTAGIVTGGRLSEWLASKGYTDSKIRAGLIAAVIHIPAGLVFPLMPNGWAALALLCPATFTLAMPFGNAPAAIQEMMPNRMRGQASSVYLFVVNIIGLGIGPTAVALCTDLVFQDDMKIRYSLLLIGTVANTLSVLLLWKGLSLFRNSLRVVADWQNADTQESRDALVSLGAPARIEREYMVPIVTFAVLAVLGLSAHPAAKELFPAAALIFLVTFCPIAIFLTQRKNLNRWLVLPMMLPLVGLICYAGLRMAEPPVVEAAQVTGQTVEEAPAADGEASRSEAPAPLMERATFETLVNGVYVMILAGFAVYLVAVSLPPRELAS